jgi:hypothetical protein
MTQISIRLLKATKELTGAGRIIRTNHKRDMKWYNYEENYSASQVTWKVMETDGMRLVYMGLERRTS